MKYKNLGNSRIKISSIGLGTNFSSDTARNERKLIKLLQKALDYRINFFDTAEVYHNGHSEILIGKAFEKKRDKVIIATKFSPLHCGYKDVLKAAEGSLKRLQTDYIDLYQVHWPNPAVLFEETFRALENLVTAGKVKYIGVSNFSVRQMKDIQKVSRLPVVSLQTEYNLVERSAELDLIPYAEKNKITVIAYTPLNSGNILKKDKYSKTFLNLSKKYKKDVSQIVLNFLVRHTAVVTIPATTSLSHLEENAGSTNFALEEKDIRIIEKIFTHKVINIDTGKIRAKTMDDHLAYETVEEALANKLKFFPSPLMLSEDIKKGDFLKPIRVSKLLERDGKFEYELLGGRIRYWAFVIAFSGKKPVPAIIEKL